MHASPREHRISAHTSRPAHSAGQNGFFQHTGNPQSPSPSLSQEQADALEQQIRRIVNVAAHAFVPSSDRKRAIEYLQHGVRSLHPRYSNPAPQAAKVLRAIVVAVLQSLGDAAPMEIGVARHGRPHPGHRPATAETPERRKVVYPVLARDEDDGAKIGDVWPQADRSPVRADHAGPPTEMASEWNWSDLAKQAGMDEAEIAALDRILDPGNRTEALPPSNPTNAAKPLPAPRYCDGYLLAPDAQGIAAIKDALAAGQTPRTIAAETGLSVQQVQNIAKGAKLRARWTGPR